VLGVSDSGYYLWHNRPPSARAIRHAWLTEQIEAVHTVSNGVYGAHCVRRVHAELTLGHGIVVGHGAVEMLMRRAGLKGLPGSRRPRPKHQTPTAADLVDRAFSRTGRDQRWSIDASQTAALVTNDLDMAIRNRNPEPGLVIHSDHGVQGGFNWSSQHPDEKGCVDGTASGMDDDGDGAAGDAVAGQAAGPPRCGALVLGEDRGGADQRGRRCRVRRVGTGRFAMVPGTRRHAFDRPRSVVGQVSVVR
jgi:hypothetical protein